MIGKTVYTVNNKTNEVDEWICIGEFNGHFRRSKTRLCVLRRDKKQTILPKRFVYLSIDKAREVAKI